MRKSFLIFISLFFMYAMSYAQNTFILIDKDNIVRCKSWFGNSDGSADEKDKAIGKSNCLNTPERQQILAEGGKIIEVEDTDIWIDDTYKNGEHKKDSPEREKIKQAKIKKEQDRASAENKLKALGLTEDEIKSLKD